MTYRDPNEPLGTDAPTEAYRAPATGAPVTPPPVAPWPGQPEAATAPAATTPATGTRPGGRPNRARWAIAAIVIALVVAGSGVAAVLLTGKAPDAAVLGWVPKESVVYGEMRLDLPGDQRANLGEFLSRFPGFADQASLDTKINEVLDRMVASGTNNEQTYTADIAPWFDGEIAFSMGELPDPATLENPDATAAAPEVVAYLSLKDGARAQAWYTDAVAGESPTTETYNGTTLTLVSSAESKMQGTVAWAIPSGGTVALLGEVDAVKKALDTNGAGGLASDADFSAALASSETDHVGYMFVNMRRYMDYALEMIPEDAPEMCGSTLSDDMLAMVPGWVAMNLRVEKDAISMGGRAPMAAEPLVAQENRESSLATRLPASTLFLAEGHDFGEGMTALLEMYRADPACAEALEQVDLAVGFLGGFDEVLGWMEDVALVVNRTADGVEGGLVFQASNPEDASDLLESIQSLIGFAGTGFSVREEAHGDATITVLDLGDAASLSALGGGMAGVPVPPGDPNARVELAWTVSGDLVVFGVGTSFIKSVLDTDEASSLGATARYGALLERVGGAENLGVVFADITAMRELAEGMLDGDAAALEHYESDAKPFIAPFDAFIQASVITGDHADTNAVVTVK